MTRTYVEHKSDLLKAFRGCMKKCEARGYICAWEPDERKQQDCFQRCAKHYMNAVEDLYLQQRTTHALLRS